MLLRSYSEDRNKKFQIQGGGANVPPPPVSTPELIPSFQKFPGCYLVPNDNLPGGTLPCNNFTMWQSFHGTLCPLALCYVTSLPYHHFARWSFCQVIILTGDHFDRWSFCQVTIFTGDHFDRWSFWHLIILTGDHFDKWSFWQVIILTGDHFDRWSFWHVIILTGDHFDR